MEWFENNSMGENPDKFQMFLGTNQFSNKCLNINGMKCITKKAVKLLGINIDWKLNFNSHVDIICTKANRKLKALYRLRSKLDFSQKLVLYNSFIMSQFNYCPVIWMFCGQIANTKIDNILRKALQSLYNDFSSNYEELLEKGNHLPIHEINKRHLLVQVYKCIKRENPPFLHHIFIPKATIHMVLRRNDTLILPKTSTVSWGLHSFGYRGSRAWNTLPDNVKDISSLNIFKSALKTISLQCTCKLCNRF